MKEPGHVVLLGFRGCEPPPRGADATTARPGSARDRTGAGVSFAGRTGAGDVARAASIGAAARRGDAGGTARTGAGRRPRPGIGVGRRGDRKGADDEGSEEELVHGGHLLVRPP